MNSERSWIEGGETVRISDKAKLFASVMELEASSSTSPERVRAISISLPCEDRVIDIERNRNRDKRCKTTGGFLVHSQRPEAREVLKNVRSQSAWMISTVRELREGRCRGVE